MPALYWSPCIVFGGVRYYLPPMLTVKDSWGQKVDVVSPPYTSRALITDVNDNQPVRISIDAKSVFDTRTQRAVLDWMNEIRLNFRGRTFALYIFSDRGYEKCALESSDLEIPLNPLVNREVSLSIVSEDYMTAEIEALDFPGGYNEDYPYARYVGRPIGEGSTGGTIVVTQSSYQTPSGHFPGIIQVTGVGEDSSIIVGGSSGSQWLLDSIQIVGCDISDPPTGNTVIRAGTNPVGGGFSITLSATVGPTQRFGASSGGGGPTLTAGERVYIACIQAGGHADVQYTVRLKAL